MAIGNNADVLGHVERLLPSVEIQLIQDQTHEAIRGIVLETVFADKQIQRNFEGAEIRYTTMCCVVVKAILQVLNEDPNTVNLMAIGDVTLPDFVTTPDGRVVPIRSTIEAMHRKSLEYEMELAAKDKLDYGYDLAAKGYKPAREMALTNWDRYYDFSDHEVEEGGKKKNLKDVLADNSTICNGGMPALNIMCMALNKEAEKKSKESKKRKEGPIKKRYIYPDNSLNTWNKIVHGSTTEGKGKFNVIRTEQKDGLHLTPEKVNEFYEKNGTKGNDDTWYITPVANPSGTRMTPEQLTSTCEAIIAHKPDATIILDCVYMRTLETKTAQALMKGVLSNPAILNRVIVLESLSKSHGLTGQRIGMFFSANKELHELVQNMDMAITAGHGHNLSAKMMAYMENPEENDAILKELHRFWGRERKGLYNYLIKSGNYADLFDEDQSHIKQDQLDEPMGLYLLVKMKPGVSKMDIYKKTGCIGVPSNLESGNYMRFAVGKIT
jgi:hypothetical protein